MAFNLENLDSLPEDQVLKNSEILAQLIKNKNPELEVNKGVIRDIIIQLGSILITSLDLEIEKIKKSIFIKNILEDPANADPKLVDALASNFGIQRKKGKKAKGKIQLIFSAKTPLVIPINSVYFINGNKYLTTNTFVIKNNNSFINENDVVFEEIGTNKYRAIIEVIAQDNGEEFNTIHGTPAIPQIKPLNFIEAYVYNDIYGGVSEESNENLIKRIILSSSSPSWSHKKSIQSLLFREFPDDLKAVSVIGYGDPGMLRDQNITWPGPNGGKIDVYVKTDNYYRTIVADLNATLINKIGAIGVWQTIIDKTKAPGFYFIKNIKRKTNISGPSSSITSEILNIDLSTDSNYDFIPEINNPIYGVFSPFQVAVVQFQDPGLDVSTMSIGTVKEYTFEMMVMPEIDKIQKFASSNEFRPVSYDVLIKAPIPLEIFASFTLQIKKGTQAPNTDKIKISVANEINKINFSNRVPASKIIDGVNSLNLSNVLGVTSTVIQGKLLKPTKQIWINSSAQELVVPEEPELMITKNTIAILCSPSNININVQFM